MKLISLSVIYLIDWGVIRIGIGVFESVEANSIWEFSLKFPSIGLELDYFQLGPNSLTSVKAAVIYPILDLSFFNNSL